MMCCCHAPLRTAGLLGALLFFLSRTFILRSANAVQRAFIALPILIGIAVYINGEGRQSWCL